MRAVSWRPIRKTREDYHSALPAVKPGGVKTCPVVIDAPALICNSTCMSTKTIAIDSRVYDKLARLRGESQSFSKLIDSLVDKVITAHTAADVLARLDDQSPLSDEDAETMLRVVRENRSTEDWPNHDLS